ncbi:MAG: diaminopropionate ammonia-lyase, partial [Acetobacteraceae bacterium]|nr:diaminopropionate ammonia-lyase [Acetobacteraceae bacterium]
MFELLVNPRHGVPGVTILPTAGFRRARAAITSWPGYTPTPLRALAHIPGVAEVRIKDEGGRFGLGSFKALGGAYAVANLLASELSRRGDARSATSEALENGGYADT